ncbi:hypothetical protein IWX90DRAFT_423416 [Phyllosticta citrichinensis]|uniref:Uncharacterized protein n=1 Tax=Phyllosticta citrichinensis TaxID=1130410 RepID=A0ABR1Y1W1_9PEZI
MVCIKRLRIRSLHFSQHSHRTSHSLQSSSSPSFSQSQRHAARRHPQWLAHLRPLECMVSLLIRQLAASPKSAESWSIEAEIALVNLLVVLAVHFIYLIKWAIESNLFGTYKRNLSLSFSRFTTTLKAVGAWLANHVVALGDCFPRLCGSCKNIFSSSNKEPDLEPDVPTEIRREPRRSTPSSPPPSSPPQEGLEIQPADTQTFKRPSHSSPGHRKIYKVGYGESRTSKIGRPPTLFASFIV